MDGSKTCIKCGAAAQEHFRALKVHTLHIRDFSGEKRVQMLGNITEFGVCRDCANEQLQKRKQGAGRKEMLPFAVILLVSIVFLTLFWNGEGALRLCGVAGVICGILGIGCTAREGRQRRVIYNGLTEEKALKKAAWEVIEDCADHKCGDHDLSYIPITPETLKLKNGDLMVCYGLLPDTAVQAWNILHQIPVKAAGVHDKRM